MSTDETQLVVLKDSNATETFGEQIGRKLKGGEVIELISDLGGGKTTLTRGIARGAGSSDVVGSPTFMLSKIYKAVTCDIYHFDFYRLTEAGLMEHELHDALSDPRGVVIVEWGEVVQHILPEERLSLYLHKTAGDQRTVELHYPSNMAYLVENI